MEPEEYMNMIKKYQKKIYEISSLYVYLENCTSDTNKCKEAISNTQIDGESIDKGKLDEILNTIDELRDVFNTIIAECNLKINEYTVLYQDALRKESESNK